MRSKKDEIQEKKLREELREKQLQATRAQKDKLIAIEAAGKAKNRSEQKEAEAKWEIVARVKALSRSQLDL